MPPPGNITTSDIWAVNRPKQSLEDLHFQDPESFVAGQLHLNIDNWNFILNNTDDKSSGKVKQWLTEGVNIEDYFTNFKGNFRGHSYDSRRPPDTIIPNHKSCQKYATDIARHLEERLRNGSLELLGKVGQVAPPTVVMPLVMVEGKNKQRLCHDERFLNLFMEKISFSLETLNLIPSMLPHDAYIANCDEKSAYDGVRLSPNSRHYFGVQFGGWWMTYTTLPFGWSLSPYIYQTIGMQVTSFFRSQGIITIQYLDDRLIGPNVLDGKQSPREATTAAMIKTLATLTSLGYTIALQKSTLQPSQSLTFLGLTIHSDARHFSIPEEKRETFKDLREQILSLPAIHVKLLQKFMGKCISFSLCIPGTKFYIREMARAMSKASKSSSLIKPTPDLIDEVKSWELIDNHPRWLPWIQEKHVNIIIATDASSYAWGAVVRDVDMSDLWEQGDSRPIHLKEAEALLLTLKAIPNQVKNTRVDARVDNMAVVHAWQHEGAKDPPLNKILKQICHTVIELNCDLRLSYIKSEDNPADAPSRKLSAKDATLSPQSWRKVEASYGPHTFDLMALDSNTQKDKSGSPLPHFTPYPLPGSNGINLFSQTLRREENYYCFPPFCMIQHVIKFLTESETRPIRVTLVVPEILPCPHWWPMLRSLAKLEVLAEKGDTTALLLPSKQGYIARPLANRMYMARINIY